MHCSIKGYQRQVVAWGWRNRHYRRWYEHGDPLHTVYGDRELIQAFIQRAIAWPRKRACLIWPYTRDGNGYARLKVGLIHRIVCHAVHGQPPRNKPDALHSCGQGHQGCISPWHLYWGNDQDNKNDSVSHGTASGGKEITMVVTN